MTSWNTVGSVHPDSAFPCLSFGTGTFGGKGPLFSAWGDTDVAEARRLVDICLDAGVTLFDTADVYSIGESEAHPRRSHQGPARPTC